MYIINTNTKCVGHVGRIALSTYHAFWNVYKHYRQCIVLYNLNVIYK